MICETPQKGAANSRLMWQLLALLMIAAILLTGCGKAFTMYPSAESANRDEGMNAVVACGSTGNTQVLIGGSGEQIYPQSYYTSDPFDTVKTWYEQNLPDWSNAGAPCENGVSYVFPKECNAALRQCDKQLFILDDYYDLGGTWIVVVSLSPSGEDNANTPSPRKTATPSSEQNYLVESVRGKGKIVFSVHATMYVMNPDGSDMYELDVAGDSPDCSPDGNRIVAQDFRSRIVIINIDGTNRVDILGTSGSNTPRWSPDGKRIVYSSNPFTGIGEIYIMNADGSEETQLTTSGKANMEQANILPIWTSNGQIAFFSQSVYPDNNKYYVMNSDGSNVTEITEETYYDYAKGWSPDRSAYIIELPFGDLTLFSSDGSISVRLMKDINAYGSLSGATWCQ